MNITENESKLVNDKVQVILKNKAKIKKLESENSSLMENHVLPFAKKYDSHFKGNTLEVGNVVLSYKSGAPVIKPTDGSKLTQAIKSKLMNLLKSEYKKESIDVKTINDSFEVDEDLRGHFSKLKLAMGQTRSLQISLKK